jgi:VWFA-related protein
VFTRFAALSGGALSLTAAAMVLAAAQDQPPQPTFRTEANYVRVDAYPTKGGAPVMDLTQEDFEILDDRAPQKIEQFEHVMIRGNVPLALRNEPNTVGQSRAMLADPRARVFVIFLDTGNVDVGGSHNIRQPLVDMLNRMIGEDDLVGFMTPEMSALGVTFTRRTAAIEEFLTDHWTWGNQGKMNPADPIEENYDSCYGSALHSQITAEMIARRREKLTLDALEDLMVYLRGAREERKAVITITDGWRLYGPSDALANAVQPTPPTVGINPGTGKLTIGDRGVSNAIPVSDCDRDRLMLSQMDDVQEYRRLLDQANRANASFYPVDPRGLPVFDTPMTAKASDMTPIDVDQGILRQRQTTLRTLADATDGLAIVDSNNLAAGLKRVIDDLSSYYLMGFYSTGKLDGKFHPITVRVKRPGIQVRARRGYLAATAASAMAGAATKAAAATPAKATAETAAVNAAIGPLAGLARDVPLRLQLAAGWKPGDSASAAVWVVGELGDVATVGESWSDGFDATATLTTLADATVATGHLSVARGVRTFRIALTPSAPLGAGEYVLRVGARAGSASLPSRETIRFSLASSDSFGALFVRRGQSTGNKEVPTADLRFRRNEQVRVEIPTSSSSSNAAAARLLDRTGNPLAVPVIAAIRDDGDGSRWYTAQVALAPLAPGDYVIELSDGSKRMLAAFRVVP